MTQKKGEAADADTPSLEDQINSIGFGRCVSINTAPQTQDPPILYMSRTLPDLNPQTLKIKA